MKRFLSILLVAAMVLTMGAAALAEDREKVVFWHLWTGNEAAIVDEIVENFNAYHDKYTVEALSVPDEQKIKVAIAGGQGPDVTDSFSANVPSYAGQNIMYCLDELIARDGVDMSQFIPAAAASCAYDGKQYAFPISLNLMMLFYNKDLFAAKNLEAPKTDEDLLNAAIALTEMNADGSMKVLGYPDFPWVYYLDNFAYALGASYTNEDDTECTIDSEGFRRALEMMVAYRDKFGVENVTRFQSGGAYLDGTDPFLNNAQAMRVDGPWMNANMVAAGKADVNYGVVPLPYLKGHEDQAGRALVSSSMFYIPATAKNVEGGWAFLQYITLGEGGDLFVTKGGSLPAKASMLNNETLMALPDYPAFAELAASPNLTKLPRFEHWGDYSKLIGDEAQLVVNGKQTIDEAIKHIEDYAADLF